MNCIGEIRMVAAGTLPLRRSEAGFTLIELLTVIAILGLLAGLSLQGFVLYRPYAAFAAVQTSKDQAVKANYAANAQVGAVFGEVEDEVQDTSGPITNATGRALLPGFQLGRQMRITYSHYPDCTLENSCDDIQTRVEIRHRQGAKYLRWIRFSDGTEVNLEIPGAGLG